MGGGNIVNEVAMPPKKEERIKKKKDQLGKFINHCSPGGCFRRRGCRIERSRAEPRLLRCCSPAPGAPAVMGKAPDRLLCMRRMATPLSSCAKLYPRDCERMPVDMSIWLPCIDGRPRGPPDVALCGVVASGMMMPPEASSGSSLHRMASWIMSMFGLTL